MKTIKSFLNSPLQKIATSLCNDIEAKMKEMVEKGLITPLQLYSSGVKINGENGEWRIITPNGVFNWDLEKLPVATGF